MAGTPKKKKTAEKPERSEPVTQHVTVLTPEQQEKLTSLRQAAQPINAILLEFGYFEIDFARPEDCLPQDVNARYMRPEVMDNLVKNIQTDKRLESAVLVTRRADGRYDIISGHHRVEGAKKAHLPFVMVLIVKIEKPEELVAKQLSHNAIVGEDDDVVLKKMFEQLGTIDLKFYSGLEDKLVSINPVSLSFRAGIFKEFTLMFMPEEIESYDVLADRIKEEIKTSGSQACVRLASMTSYETFMDLVRKIKRVENVKNNAAAFQRILELAQEGLKLVQARQAEAEAKEPEPQAES